jgi:tetratricopeptide (TPR) repeat protein
VQSLPRSLPVRVEMASQSLEYLDHLAATRGTDPAFNKELAEGYLRLGGILQSPYGYGDSLGNSGKALESDRKAVELLEALAKVKPSDPAIQLDLARAYLNLGPALNLNGKPDEAVASVQRATAMFDRLAASRPEDLAIQVEAGRAWAAAMDVLSSKGGGISDASTKDRVLAAGNQAIAHLEAALARSPADADALSGLASAYKVLATIYYGTADFQQAIAVCEKSLDALQRMPPAARETPENQGFKAQLESLIGQSDGQMGKYAAALAILKPAQQVLDRLAAEDPRNATPAYRRMNLYRARSNVNENAGHLGDAIADGRVAVQILDQLIEIDPAKTSYRVVRAEVQQKMAKQLADSGQMAEAKRYGEAGVAYLDEVAERPDASAQSLIEAAYARMEPPIPSLADYPRAIRYAQRADQLTSGKNPVAVFYLAQAYENALDGPKALAALQRFGALLPPTPPGQKPSRFRSISEKHLRQIQYLIKTGRLPKSGME